MDIQESDIKELLEFFSKNTYNAWDTHPTLHQVMQRCLELFGKDYTYSVVTNNNGELSTNYPSFMVILESMKSKLDSDPEVENEENGEKIEEGGCLPNGNDEANENGNLANSTCETFNPMQELPRIKDLCQKARYARCRARFPVPVILYNKKHICRSATLSGGPEIYGRTSFDYFFAGSSGVSDAKGADSESPEDDVIVPDTVGQGDWQIFDRVRNQDIRLLKSFRVQTIIDLMVEKKKVKFGVYVTSSEKVDKKKRYSDFNLISLPYPGCEFFRQYRDNGYSGEELMFEWNQGYVDANISVPPDPITGSLKLDWEQYRQWDLIRLTQNYLKLLLAYLKSENSGVLIHCISGWDRTPLFVSMLRLSLWADGAIHQSLNAEQILYLTLAYDWLLFGHNLEDRLNKGEEILAFCFYFLKHIVSAEYSIDGPISGADILEEETTFGAGDIESNANIPNLANGNTGVDYQNSTSLNGISHSCINGDHTEPHENHEMNVLTSPAESAVVQIIASVTSNGSTETHNGNSILHSVITPCNVVGVEDVSTDRDYTKPELPITMSERLDSVPKETPPGNGGSPSIGIDVLLDKNLNGHAERPVTDCDENGSSGCDSVSEKTPLEVSDKSSVEGEREGASNGVNSLDDKNGLDNPHCLDNGSNISDTEATTDICGKKYEGPMLNGFNGCTAENESQDGVIQKKEISQEVPSKPNCDITRSDSAETPKHQNGVENGVSTHAADSGIPTMPKLSPRAERLLLVQTHFNALYFPATGLQSRHLPNDNTGSSGLSVIIDNIATKVGIRAANRSTS